MNAIVQIFKSILEISLFASVMIIVVLLVRAASKDRINIKVVSFLWLLVILRLCLPGMLESPVHLDGLLPETAVSQEAANQPASYNAVLSGGQNDTPGSTLPEYTAEHPIENAASDMAATEPQPVSFFEQLLNFIESLDIWMAAAILWVIGGAIVLAAALKESVAFSLRRRKYSRPLINRKILDIVEVHKKANHLRRGIKVFTCPAIRMPMAVGVFHPQILLPPDLTKDLSEEHLNAILLHEICHIKRNDILINYVCLLAKALHWFNPLVWLGLKKMKADLEFSCDRRVLKQMKAGQEVKYCESLLYATCFMKQRRIPLFVTSLCENKSNLKERIIKMINPQKKSKSVTVISLVLVFIMAVACFTTACQPTPENKVVVGRQNDILEDITPIPSGDFKKNEVPDHVNDVYDFSKISVNFDAHVIVPETTAYPVIEFSKRIFSDNEILTLIKRFSGTNDKLYSKWTLTKSEWMERITKVRQYVSSGVFSAEYLDSLQALCDTADEEVNNPLVSLSDLPASAYSHIYVKKKNNRVALFSIMRNQNYFSYCKDMLLITAPASQYEDSDFDSNTDTIKHFKWVQPGEPEISQEAAFAQASEYVNELDMGLDLYSAEPCTVIVGDVDKSVGWRFIFTRKLSNLQVPYRYDGTYLNPDALPSYGAPWVAPEVCVITIDKNGICELLWQGASKVSKVALNTVELEPFNNIQSRIANQLKYIYGNPIRDVGIDIKITKIELGTSLISVKDKADIGIYIPTWYAEYHIKWKDVERFDDQLDTVIFNAIDGSYIEPRVTNEKILSMSS